MFVIFQKYVIHWYIENDYLNNKLNLYKFIRYFKIIWRFRFRENTRNVELKTKKNNTWYTIKKNRRIIILK